jgi:hypothetical protein
MSFFPQFICFAFLDVPLHGVQKHEKNIRRKNNQKSQKKAPTHLRGRFFWGCPLI